MKKIVNLIGSFVVLGGLVGCSNSAPNTPDRPVQSITSPTATLLQKDTLPKTPFRGEKIEVPQTSPDDEIKHRLYEGKVIFSTPTKNVEITLTEKRSGKMIEGKEQYKK